MRKNALLLFMILLCSYSFGQQEKVTIYGTINSDGAELENIHILNKNSKEGTITDSEGNFTIEVKEKDTISITGIQYYYLEVPITKTHIIEKKLNISLFQKRNELEEVELKHNLTGNISIDSDQLKIAKNIEDGALNFSNIDLNLVGIKIDPSSRSRTSNDSQLMPNTNADIIAIAAFVFEPIIKEVVKIGATKRKIKKYEKRYENSLLEAPANIRASFGDTFFTETLKISADHIDEFIATCLPKGIAMLYVDNKRIEIIDIFLAESEIYLKQIKK